MWKKKDEEEKKVHGDNFGQNCDIPLSYPLPSPPSTTHPHSPLPALYMNKKTKAKKERKLKLL